MTHPIDSCNEAQQKFLSECPPEQRRMNELIFIVGNATYRYHQQAKDFNPTIKDWEDWLEGLPENIRNYHHEEGFARSKGVLNFTRFVMEKNDVGLDQFLRDNIAPEILQEYLELQKT
jgi:hypothetical protein